MTVTVALAGWTSERVSIHCDPNLPGEEWRDRDGLVHSDAPGLAITPREDFSSGPSRLEFVITHIKSGMRIGDGWTLSEAQIRALMFGYLGLGDLEPADIKKQSPAWRALAQFARGADLDLLEEKTLSAFHATPAGRGASDAR